MQILSWALLAAISFSTTFDSVNAEEIADKIEIDWSNLRVRYYGIYQHADENLALGSWQELAEQAVQSGLTNFVARFPVFELNATNVKLQKKTSVWRIKSRVLLTYRLSSMHPTTRFPFP